MISLHAAGIRLRFDPSIGMLQSFVVSDGDTHISPLHQAPWVDTGEALPVGIAPHLAKLGGDFFCAPFAQESEGSPFHGWSANSPWSIEQQSENTVIAKLDRRILGAELFKHLTVLPGHPFVYQRHTFVGGRGDLPVSNHANISLPNGGRLYTSPKQIWVTPDHAPESDPAKGRSGLKYPARSNDPTAFPSIEGVVDLTRYPWFLHHEDFVVGIDNRDSCLGWTAIVRPEEGDLFLSLKETRHLPMTMLWHSNGGRDYAPWSSRHFGCLGIEEGAAPHLLSNGQETSAGGPKPLSLHNGLATSVRHVIGAMNWPKHSGVREIRVANGTLEIIGDDGCSKTVSFDSEFLLDDYSAVIDPT